ncbi:MAG: polymer-forming cytoskeletal protein [candidate division KSB1 bacterium]|nr:polymer-forming cytoskeletal protein [candidate division KSB1 bacterium]MDZ7273924.1 polymer-forming cytoskeletal protein [candidate division KSB1 bacterium]MDZ7286080.1 polymer-forming cytoskeletal protein [candidate division KSB1 bacterium]MDZ7299112.1 polymer-forming cytoskeletal protein [candidate division KSB1 bacterium]MDZ7306659.1 polymer-forming cytoskeletal protein [candidate division KSB1 bacterium]
MKFSFLSKLFGDAAGSQPPPAQRPQRDLRDFETPLFASRPAPPNPKPVVPRTTTSQPSKNVMEDTGKTGDLNTIIGKGAVIDGTIKVQNSMRLDGRVTGHILTTDALVVGKDGEIRGEVRTKNAVIGGLVNGQVFASGKVVLESRAVLKGDIKTTKLMVNDGARFDGNCSMSEDGGVKALTHGQSPAEATRAGDFSRSAAGRH